MAREWFVKHEGKEFGPYTDGQLISLAHDGSIGTATAVRQRQSAEWIKAGTVPGLFKTSPKASAPAASAAATPAPAVAAPKPVYQAQPVPQPAAAASPPSPKPKYQTPLLIGGAVGCALLGATVVGFVMRPGTKGAADAQEESASKVAAPGAAKAKGAAVVDPSIASIEGKWISDGVAFSPKFGKPAILTIKGRTGEWRELNSQTARDVTKITPMENGVIGLVIDGTIWEAKRLLNDELQFRQPDKSPNFFPNLRPYRSDDPVIKLATAQAQPKVAEITWEDALTRFGAGDPEQRRVAFIPVSGAMMQVSGVVKTTEPLIGYFDLGRDDHSTPIRVSIQEKDKDFHLDVQPGDRVEVRGRLVDYPGIVSPFTVNDAEFVRDKCTLASDPKSDVYFTGLRNFDEHPKEILDALKKGSEVWLLRDCELGGLRSASYRYVSYLILENDALVRVAGKTYTPDKEMQWSRLATGSGSQIKYERFNVGHDLTDVIDKEKKHFLKWQWMGSKKGNNIEAKNEIEFHRSGLGDFDTSNLAQRIDTKTIVVDTAQETWTQTLGSFMRLKKPSRDFPDGIIRSSKNLFGKAERLTK